MVGDYPADANQGFQKKSPYSEELSVTKVLSGHQTSKLFAERPGSVLISNVKRSEMLAQLDDTKSWDFAVIGGGATGLGVAMDAASRGYRTVLLEAADLCEGTSSRSTKLIHGGVRYLRAGEIALVRESLRERGRLFRNAPDLVNPMKFLVPAYRWWEPWFYGIGMKTYDLLSGGLRIGASRHRSRKAALEDIPNLNNDDLRGGTRYFDAQFDDARLATAFAQSAADAGAAVINYLRVTELQKTGDRVSGVTAVDQQTGSEYSIKAKCVINATGVFTDEIRSLDDADAPDVITPSQGIHITIDQKFLGGDTALMVPDTDDGRVLFAIPWHNRCILGTTDTPGVPVELHPKPLEEEIDYLVEHAARFMAEAPKHADIKASFAGLRPLVRPPSKSGGATSKISRNHSIFVSDSGLLTIAGGKWTTVRQMAEDTVDRAIEVAGVAPSNCVTADRKLPVPPVTDDSSPALHADLPYTEADVTRAVRDEMALSLTDILARRTRCLFLDAEATRKCAPRVAEIAAAELGKDQTWIDQQIAALPDVP